MNNMSPQSDKLGIVIAGSLTDGLDVKLDRQVNIEDIKVGRYITIQGKFMRFFGVVNDVMLNSTDPSMSNSPPDVQIRS